MTPSSYGGWRYAYNEWPDNSACQWDAIGLIAAERVWGIMIPQWVKDANKNWLVYSQNSGGYFGYTDTNPAWGPLATTASGLVQMVMDGLGRTSTAPPNWVNAESYLRNTWDTNPGYGPMKTNYLLRVVLVHQGHAASHPTHCNAEINDSRHVPGPRLVQR